MKMKPMTNEEYLKANTMKCPSCRGESISSAEVGDDLENTTEVSRCNRCDFLWKDVRSVVGYEVIPKDEVEDTLYECGRNFGWG